MRTCQFGLYNRECQEVVKVQNNNSIDEEYMGRIVEIITDGLKFGRCQGCDPTPWTVSGAATFRTGAKDKSGNPINVGCLVRVEANPQAGAFRYVLSGITLKGGLTFPTHCI